MSKIASVCLVFLVLLGGVLPINGQPDEDFEGVITYELKSDEGQDEAKKDQLTFKVKNNKVRIDVQDPESDVSEKGATILIDMNKGKYVTMIEKDGQKMAMAFSLDEFKEMMADVGDDEGEESAGTNVEVTDETKDIDGYECKKVVMANDQVQKEAWITQDIEIDFSKLFPVFETTDNWQRYSDAYQGFVMEVHNKDLETKKSYSYIASVNEQSLEDKLFNVPSSYQEVDMGQMMEQFKEANPDVYEKMLDQLQH